MAEGSRYQGGTEDYYSRASPFDFNAAYTVSLWFKLESGLTDYHHFFHVGSIYVYDGITDTIGLDNDGVTLRCGCAGGTTNSFTTGSALTAGVWYLIQMVRESSTSLKIYLNGVLDITMTNDVGARTAASNIFIGSYNGKPCRGFLAAVKSWTAVLSGAERTIEGLYYQAVKAAPWSVWPLFNDHDDDSGNARHLTLVGGEAFDLGPSIAWAPGGEFPARWIA